MNMRTFIVTLVLAHVAAPNLFSGDIPAGFKVSVPVIAEHPKVFFVEAQDVNVLIHHGIGENLVEGSLVVNVYKDVRSTASPIDLWIAGIVLRREGELCDVSVMRSAENSDDLVLIVFIKYKGMTDAVVLHCAAEGHVPNMIMALDDIHGGDLVKTVRTRCAKIQKISKYFEVPRK
jgi:hypothetical protein